jgi:alpha-tubulin suppressor-like RCC1 family protein
MKTLGFGTLLCVALFAQSCVDFQKAVADCVADGRCTQVARKELGQACTENNDCQSRFCADGVCCQSACEGQCQVCNATPGTCTLVSGAPQGGRAACNDDGNGCGGTCNGQDAACAYPTNSCRASGCTAGTLSAEAFCSNGACPASQTQACAAGICGTNACATVVQISAGESHTCAVLSDGSVKCWGSNDYGQCGQDPETLFELTSPMTVPNLAGVTKVTVGYDFSCALLSNGTVKCWGSNYNGQLGQGNEDFTEHPTPVAVSSLTGIQELAASSQGWHVCAAGSSSGGGIWCWGYNAAGQLGDGTKVDRLSPTPVCTTGATGAGCAAATGASNLEMGYLHSCMRRQGGSIACWGNNGSYEALVDPVGGTERLNPATPSPSQSTSNFTTPLAAGNATTCVLKTGKAYCYGVNGASGRLGVGDTSNPAVNKPLCSAKAGAVCGTEQDGVAQVGLGYQHGCAVVSGAVLKCFGGGDHGVLGDGVELSQSPVTLQVPNLTSVKFVAVGAYHNCVILNDGSVRCWGWNGSGQVGAGSSDPDVLLPTSPVW